MWQKGMYILLGMVVAPAARSVLKGVARPVTREVIRFGILTSDKVHEIAQEVREDFEDLTAEARAEINREAGGGTKGRKKSAAS